jgi:hypothetical protein
MKKNLRRLLVLPLILIVFGAALWWTFPWESAFRYGLTEAGNRAAAKGLALSCGAPSAEGGLEPLFRCGDFRLRHPLGGVDLVRGEARLRPLASILGRGVALDVRFGPGRFETMTGQTLSWDQGTVSLILRPDLVVMDKLAVKGELSAQGRLEISPSRGRIVRAMVEVGTPATADGMMQALTAFLPLKRVKSGEWRLERK